MHAYCCHVSQFICSTKGSKVNENILKIGIQDMHLLSKHYFSAMLVILTFSALNK